jgi:hypothetical protein
MATTKKTDAKATEVEVKAEAKAPAKTAEKKAPAKKATTKKAAAPKKTEEAVPAKKTPAKKTAAKKAPAKKAPAKKATATKVEVFVEFGGAQVSIDEVIKNVKLVNGKTAKDLTIYIKPEESKAYFVADGEDKEMDVYFC